MANSLFAARLALPQPRSKDGHCRFPYSWRDGRIRLCKDYLEAREVSFDTLQYAKHLRTSPLEVCLPSRSPQLQRFWKAGQSWERIADILQRVEQILGQQPIRELPCAQDRRWPPFSQTPGVWWQNSKSADLLSGNFLDPLSSRRPAASILALSKQWALSPPIDCSGLSA